MNKLKKTFIFALVAVMTVCSCFALSACSGKDDKKIDSAASDASKPEDNETQSDAVTSDAAPVSSDATAETIAPQPEAVPAPAPEKAPENTEQKSADNSAAQQPQENTKPKYADAEVYENENGNKAAKTESGVEVELTPENMSKLIGEYEKVKGSGSEQEKQILDQIQLLLEANMAE